MGFVEVRNVRINSLTPGAVVKLRLGKAATKATEDLVVEAILIQHYKDGEKSLVDFQETGDDGQVSTTTISRFPNAPWKAGSQYVSLLAVDPSTFTVQTAASPIQTDVIGRAIELIEKERDDVYGAERLVALLEEIQKGKRINNTVKALAIQFANRIVTELSSLQPQED